MSFAPPPNSDRPVRVILDQGRLSRWGYRLPWILFFIALFFAFKNYTAYQQYMQTNPRLEERYVSHSKTALQKVAIITVEGTILHSDGFASWQIDHVRDDPDVKAVVLRVDSPGGTVTGSDYLYHHLKLLRDGEENYRSLSAWEPSRPAADTTFRWPPAVFPTRFSRNAPLGPARLASSFRTTPSAICCQLEHVDDSVVSGKFKAMGSPTRKVSPQLAEEEHQILQSSSTKLLTISRKSSPNPGRNSPNNKQTSPPQPPAKSSPPNRRWIWASSISWAILKTPSTAPLSWQISIPTTCGSSITNSHEGLLGNSLLTPQPAPSKNPPTPQNLSALSRNHRRPSNPASLFPFHLAAGSDE